MQTATPELRAAWSLDPDVTFLNHGGFGATPRVVLSRQAALRAEMEAEPVDVRRRLAAYLLADPEGLLPIPNATAGINAVLRCLD